MAPHYTLSDEQQWVAGQKRKYADLCDEKIAEFTTLFRENMDWLNEYHTGVFSHQEESIVSHMLKTTSRRYGDKYTATRTHVRDVFTESKLFDPPVVASPESDRGAHTPQPTIESNQLDDFFQQCLNTVKKGTSVSDAHRSSAEPSSLQNGLALSTLSPIQATDHGPRFMDHLSPLTKPGSTFLNRPITRMSTSDTMHEVPGEDAYVPPYAIDSSRLAVPSEQNSVTLPSSSPPLGLTKTTVTASSLEKRGVDALSPKKPLADQKGSGLFSFPSLSSVVTSQPIHTPAVDQHSANHLDFAAQPGKGLSKTVPRSLPLSNTVETPSSTAGEGHSIQPFSTHTSQPTLSQIADGNVENGIQSKTTGRTDSTDRKSKDKFLSGTERLRKALEQLRPTTKSGTTAELDGVSQDHEIVSKEVAAAPENTTSPAYTRITPPLDLTEQVSAACVPESSEIASTRSSTDQGKRLSLASDAVPDVTRSTNRTLSPDKPSVDPPMTSHTADSLMTSTAPQTSYSMDTDTAPVPAVDTHTIGSTAVSPSPSPPMKKVCTQPEDDPFVVSKPTASTHAMECSTPNDHKSSANAQGMRTPSTLAHALSAPFAGGSYIVQKLLSAMKMTSAATPPGSDPDQLPQEQQDSHPQVRTQAPNVRVAGRSNIPGHGNLGLGASTANAEGKRTKLQTASRIPTSTTTSSKNRSDTPSDLQSFRNKLTQAKAAMQKLEPKNAGKHDQGPAKLSVEAGNKAPTTQQKPAHPAPRGPEVMRTMFKSLNHKPLAAGKASNKPQGHDRNVHAPERAPQSTVGQPTRSTLKATTPSTIVDPFTASVRPPTTAVTAYHATVDDKENHCPSQSQTPDRGTPLTSRAKEFTPTSFNRQKEAVITEYQDVMVPVRSSDGPYAESQEASDESGLDSFVSSTSHMSVDGPASKTPAPIPISVPCPVARSPSEEYTTLVTGNNELPEIPDEYSDDDSYGYDTSSPESVAGRTQAKTYKGQRIPFWATSPAVRDALMRQNRLNPERIFGKVRPIKVEDIFNKQDRRYRIRSSSANWSGSDKLSVTEEKEYEKRMGYHPV
ncbi:hypothetical protein IWQ62_003578 [Dispira parvispora]|uniref:Inner centromere protein ARK-binding domain-containing protein n=1 Tax=Dispira parvispora TaxID=1520584 RepID=A0A9W8AUK3_9FUNG|nr:hypothetical protein IWQ62_003578 [Dispira parvispora]